jgi:predicted transposase YdaD
VHPGNAGINKPFDRILKSFADEAPELFLRLLGFVPAGIKPDIQPLRPETAPAIVLPDYVAVVRVGQGDPVIFHAEFQSNYSHDVPRDMARYGGSLAWQHQMPVESALVMLRPDRAPAKIPEVGHYDIGVTHTTHPFKVIRLWEIDPTPVLETNDPKLLPWALLLKSTDEQVRKIASIVARQEDDDAVGRFLTLGVIRYDRDSLNEMIGGGKMGLLQAILDGKAMEVERARAAAEGQAEGQAKGLAEGLAEGRAEGLAEGLAEGRAEGLAEGRAAEARKVLRLLLRKHLPELEPPAEIDEISNVDALESIIESALDATGADAIRAAILTAARKN